ncbi:MAG: trypsin-like peptidase domain-containing protein [SAR324 cluster bacterium]|uniref:Serine protease n=1 Tax=SAR324 cluster bacterium TaxID=2024889 RepID=A0A7X9FTU3_9DELT|nr:trypsin-like peptidase domain-containing protein [SAR324 cluster bacterium]
MKFHLRNILFIFSLQLLFVHLASSQVKPQIDFNKSVFLLSSKDGACASGFLVDQGKLLTNYHVVSSVCPFADCKDLQVLKASRIDGPPSEAIKIQKATLLRSFPAMDLALIDIGNALRYNPTIQTATSELPPPGTELFAVGFPSCETLKVNSGTLISSDPMHLSTSINGAFGSSGSPVFLGDGRLIGVVIQAISLRQAFENYLFKKPFNLRAVRLDSFQDLLSKSDLDSFKAEVRILNNYYSQALQDKKGLDRMMSSYQFIAAAQGLRSQVLINPSLSSLAPQFLWFDDYFDSLPQILKFPEKNPDLYLEIEKLLVALNLELNGPQRSLFKLLNVDEIKGALQKVGRPESHIIDIANTISSAITHKYYGVQIQLIIYCTITVIILLVICALWGASIMYVFLENDGSFISNTFKALAVALFFWPLSFLLFLFLHQRQEYEDGEE